MEGGIYLLLGTNLGDRKLNLEQAVEKIAELASVLRKSAIYWSQAWGKTDQPDFFNQVVEISSLLTAEQLLPKLLTIEFEMGRKREMKWGARSIDIDLLLFRDVVLNLPDLNVPHPEIANRRFTLLPLCELAAEMIHPVSNKKMADLLAECRDNLNVSRLL